MNCCILPATVLKKTRTINYYPVWSIHPIRKYYGYYDVLPCKHGIRNDVPGGKSGRGDTGYANQADKDALELAMLLSFQELHFGVNMFEDLQPGDPRFERYLRMGYSQADAALKLFLEKHFPRIKPVRSMESTASTPMSTDSDATLLPSWHCTPEKNRNDNTEQLHLLQLKVRRLEEDAKNRNDYIRKLEGGLKERDAEIMQLKRDVISCKERSAQNAAQLERQLYEAEDSKMEAEIERDRRQAVLTREIHLHMEALDIAKEKDKEIDSLQKEYKMTSTKCRDFKHQLDEAKEEIRRLREEVVFAVSVTKIKCMSPIRIAHPLSPWPGKNLFPEVESCGVQTSHDETDDAVLPSVTSRGGLSFVALLILSHCLMAALIMRYSYANSITCDEVLSPDPIPCFTPPPSGEWVEYTMQIPVPELPTSDAVSSQLERVVESAVKNFFDAPETYRGL